MPSLLSCLVTATILATSILASPTKKYDRRSTVERAGVVYNVFEHAATGATIEFVNNSGICEMTPGVKQYSGYLSVGDMQDMWFWFFEARNKPESAPLATWFNGGPGCSGMIGLFQENGPCKFELGEENTVPINNTFSFNNNVNMLYIDQPIEVGFSRGNSSVTSTKSAAPYVWNLIQAFYASFPQYKSREFGIFTESYGGHYGAEFARYIQQQNRNQAGEHINLVALGINNGWHDSIIQEPAYVDFALNNSYHPFITEAEHKKYRQYFVDYCLPDLQLCQKTGTNFDCATADRACTAVVESPLFNRYNFNNYDIRKPPIDNEPPANYLKYLMNPQVIKAIGAKKAFIECSPVTMARFVATGDIARGYLDELSEVVSSNLTTLLWAGDADYTCNWYGVRDVANAVAYPGHANFAAKPLSPFKVNGKVKGTFKTEGNLSFLRVYQAGHMVMYYQPELSLQVFEQTMRKKAIRST